MRKKGLVYRATTLLGLSIIAFQFGGELVYAKYFRSDRDQEIKQEQDEETKIDRFERADGEDAEKPSGGIIGSWRDKRKARLEKIKMAKERPDAPLLEELKGKPGTLELKTRKLVIREDIAKDARKDDYI